MSQQDLANPAVAPKGFITNAPPREALLLPAKTWLSITGWELIALWAIWWMLSFFNHVLVFSGITLVPAWYFIGLDFFHNYFGSISWLSGRDPYIYKFGDGRGLFGYPPIVLPLFGWCVWFTFSTAAILFACFIAAVSAIGTLISLRFRRVTGLMEFSAPLAVGAVLFSLPVLFAMERSNCDTLVLTMVLIAAWAMARGKGLAWDLVAGIALAVAMWIKIYPGILFLAPLVMRRYRVFAFAILAAAAIGALTVSGTAEWLGAAGSTQTARVGPIGELKDWLTGNASKKPLDLSFSNVLLRCAHSLTTYWPFFWGRLGVTWLARIPNLFCAGLVLGPLTLWGSYHFFKARVQGWFVYPLLLWLALIATFLMPLSYDYNMVYFPLLIIAVWDKRDPWWVHALLLPALLWWQPFVVQMPLQADVMNIVKLISLAGVTAAMLRRIAEGSPSTDKHNETTLNTPTSPELSAA